MDRQPKAVASCFFDLAIDPRIFVADGGHRARRPASLPASCRRSTKRGGCTLNPLRTIAILRRVRQRWRTRSSCLEISVTIALLVVTSAHDRRLLARDHGDGGVRDRSSLDRAGSTTRRACRRTQILETLARIRVSSRPRRRRRYHSRRWGTRPVTAKAVGQRAGRRRHAATSPRASSRRSACRCGPDARSPTPTRPRAASRSSTRRSPPALSGRDAVGAQALDRRRRSRCRRRRRRLRAAAQFAPRSRQSREYSCRWLPTRRTSGTCHSSSDGRRSRPARASGCGRRCVGGRRAGTHVPMRRPSTRSSRSWARR